VSELRVWQSDMIEKLRSQLGDEDGVLVREILQLYLVQARDLLAQLEVASRDADEYQIRGLAHSLKGSTATVGGARLAAVCDRIEHASSAELASPDVWRDAQDEFELLAAELEHHRPRRGTGRPGRTHYLDGEGLSVRRFPA
jgi:HPt (histidine-containing phosphotransfer) domain-containing protein